MSCVDVVYFCFYLKKSLHEDGPAFEQTLQLRAEPHPNFLADKVCHDSVAVLVVGHWTVDPLAGEGTVALLDHFVVSFFQASDVIDFVVPLPVRICVQNVRKTL